MAMEATTMATEEFADKYFSEFPAGIRFRPFDKELVVDYLKNKVLNKPMPLHLIKTCNIYRSHPSELCRGNNLMRVKERYFFTTRVKKYSNRSEPDRKAGDGFWKATSRDFPIRSKGEVVGFKKTLVYYEGKPKGTTVIKTNWIMHEYRLNPEIIPSTTTPVTEGSNPGDDNNNILDECVLVKIYNNDSSYRKREASPCDEDEDEDHNKRQNILNSEPLPAETDQHEMILGSEQLPAEAQDVLMLEPEEFPVKDEDETDQKIYKSLQHLKLKP